MNSQASLFMQKGTSWIFLFLFLFLYLLNYLTPLIGDDYAYLYFYSEDSCIVRPTSKPVSSLLELFQSQWNHYCCVNGRFSSHLCVQFFMAFLGKAIFNVVNAVVLVICVKKVCELISAKQSLLLCLSVILLFFSFIPFPGQTVLWLTGSINYLWTTTFTLYVLYYFLYSKDEAPAGVGRHAFFFIAGLLVGWMNESVTVGVAGGCFLYYMFNRNKFVGTVRSLYLGYLLGALLIVLSPGTFSRMQAGEVSTSMSVGVFFFSHAYALFYSYLTNVFPILPLFVAVILFIRNRSNFIQVIKQEQLLILIYVVTTVFLFLLGLYDERIYFGISVLSLILAGRMVNTEYDFNRPVFRYIGVVFVLFFFYKAVGIAQTVNDFRNYKKEEINAIQQAPHKCILLEKEGFKSSRFCYAMGTSPDRHNFHNRVMSFYYGKDYIQFLSRELYELEKKTPVSLDKALFASVNGDKSDTIYRLSDRYWIMPVARERILKKKIDALYKKKDASESLSNTQHFVRAALNTLNTYSKVGCFYIQKGNRYYYILPSQQEVTAVCFPLKGALGEQVCNFLPVK